MLHGANALNLTGCSTPPDNHEPVFNKDSASTNCVEFAHLRGYIRYMSQRRPRDYDPDALEHMPDQPPRNLDTKAPGRWVLPESLLFTRRLAGPSTSGASKLVRGAYLRSQGDYYAYLNQGLGEHQGWQCFTGLVDVNIDPNRYGMYSRAKELYPQVYKSIDTSFWRSIGEEERQELMRRQAAAQERVGFERHTEKFFIGDVQVEGLLGPGEEPSAAEMLTDQDTDYALRRKAYQQRAREREEIRLGKRKRYTQYSFSRDDANCELLALPTVVEGIAQTPALKSMLPDAAALCEARQKEAARLLELKKPAPDSLGMRRLRDKKKRLSYRDLPKKNNGPLLINTKSAREQFTENADAREGAQKRSSGFGRRFTREAAQINTRNKYGLTSRSELSYPQAYAPVASEMWTGLTQEERTRQYVTQAIAQEKAGFEKGAPKFFIEDFDPDQAHAPKMREHITGLSATPRIEPSTASLWGGTILLLALSTFVVCWLLDLLTGKLIALLAVALVLGGAMVWPHGKAKR
jgi:hypothetical protein